MELPTRDIGCRRDDRLGHVARDRAELPVRLRSGLFHFRERGDEFGDLADRAPRDGEIRNSASGVGAVVDVGWEFDGAQRIILGTGGGQL